MNNFRVLISDRTQIEFHIFQRIMSLGVVQATGYLIHEEEKEEEKTERMQQNSMKQGPS
jgi:hypothetical protein